jgi:hypothetical protein
MRRTIAIGDLMSLGFVLRVSGLVRFPKARLAENSL